jgi:uncharacterized protein (TIGR03437 family)
MIALTAPTAVATAPASTSVLNGASYQPAVAPGSVISIMGSGLGNDTQAASGVPLATTLQNVTVSFNGIPAPLFYVSPTQINAQTPYGLAPGNATLKVTTSGTTAVSQDVAVSAVAPGIFTLNTNGSGPGVILRSDDYQVIGEHTPTTAGAYISIYCTGLGVVTTAVADGTPAPNPPATTAVVPQVTVGNIPARVTFSGLAPGYAGLYQVNVQIPTGVPTGSAIPVVLTAADVSSNMVTIVIQ